jgi:hypothetical protein
MLLVTRLREPRDWTAGSDRRTSTGAADWTTLRSLVILGALVLLQMPEVVVAGYALIAAVGFVMAVRDTRAHANNEFAREFAAAGERLMARVAASQDAARDLPWYDEVNAAQNAAVARGAPMIGLFTSFNPYWSLPFESLIRHGLTTEAQIRVVTAMARDEPPEDWRNGFIVSELIAAEWTREEALVRIGLFTTNKERFGG